jgi:DNA-binding XRE family transcriptional regulator
MTSQNLLNKAHGSDPMPQADDRALLKRPQVARAINVSTRTIDNWQKQKKIPYLKLSARCVRYHLPSVISALRKFEIKEVS